MQNKRYPSEWLGELKTKNDIVATISSYIPLVKRGSQYWARCPFHHEKTPSFAINENDQYYHCFGCGESGDVIKFVEKMESITPGEAIIKLAEKAGLELPALEDREKVAYKKKERDEMIKALNLAKEQYVKLLYEPSAKLAQEYVRKRGFKRSDLERFQIGYAHDNRIIEKLTEKDISREIMLKAGIIGEIDGKIYDHISDRLVFPILNSYGDCIGFSGRTLVKSDYKAKYKNTSQTLVYDKSSSIYGIHLLKEAKKSGLLNEIVLVEGQIDVIMMHSYGFVTTVASLGTSFTEKHAKELKRFSDNLTILFDGDSAGEKATLRVIEILKPFEFNLRIARLPSGMDPDDYLKENGAEKMKEVLKSAKIPIEYKLDLLKEKCDFTKNEDKANYVKKALELISTLETMSEKDIFLKIISENSGVPLDILKRDYKYVGEVRGASEEKKVLRSAEDGNIKAIKYVLLSILKEEVFAKLDFDIKRYLSNPIFINVLTTFEGLRALNREKTNKVLLEDLIEELDTEEKQFVLDILETNDTERVGESGKKYFDHCVWKIIESDLKMRQLILNEKYKESESREERAQISGQISEIASQLKRKSLI